MKTKFVRMILSFVMLVVVVGVFPMADCATATPALAASYYVILDPGHGGNDPGAPPVAVAQKCGVPTDLKEKDRTLDIAKRVRDILQANGIRVGLTRDGDTNPSLPDRTNYINRERPNLAVSIHANSADSCGDGVEAWYSSVGPGWGGPNPYTEASRQLAQRLANKINQTFGLRLRRDKGIADAAGNLHMVRELVVPSALIETAFISNRTEALLLRDRPGDFASAIAQAILDQLGVVPATCPTITDWKGEYWNNQDLNGSPVLCRNDRNVNFDWGAGSPGGNLPSDHFSARWTRNVSLSAGRYRFHLSGDDGIRLWVDGNLVIDQWRDQGRTEYIAERDLAGGSHSFKVEYYENGGGANVALWWEGPLVNTCSGQYRAEYYNNRSLSSSPTFVRCESWPINFDWGGGGPGSGVGNDNFSARWTGRANFSTGNYTFVARADDGIRVYLDGSLIIDAWRDQAPTEYRHTRNVSGGEHEIKVEYYENGGGAVAQFRWEQAQPVRNLALGRPAFATSQESASSTPGKGNDGSIATRWSSRISTTLGDEWWWTDLGTQTFDRVVIRWEGAYAAQHFIGWSDDGVHFTGYWYTINQPGEQTYSVGTRTARYVGVLMRSRAPRMNNYSFLELEVYQGGGAAANAASALATSDLKTIERSPSR